MSLAGLSGFIPLPPGRIVRLDSSSDETFAKWISAGDRESRGLTLQEFADRGEYRVSWDLPAAPRGARSGESGR